MANKRNSIKVLRQMLMILACTNSITIYANEGEWAFSINHALIQQVSPSNQDLQLAELSVSKQLAAWSNPHIDLVTELGLSLSRLQLSDSDSLENDDDIQAGLWLNNKLAYKLSSSVNPFVALDIGAVNGNNSQVMENGAIFRLHSGLEFKPSKENMSIQISAGYQEQ